MRAPRFGGEKRPEKSCYVAHRLCAGYSPCPYERNIALVPSVCVDASAARPATTLLLLAATLTPGALRTSLRRSIFRFKMTTTMTEDEIKLSMFLDMPVADGLDALEEALKLYHSSKGQTKEQARRIIAALRLMFSKLAPRCTSASHWERLRHEVIQAIG